MVGPSMERGSNASIISGGMNVVHCLWWPDCVRQKSASMLLGLILSRIQTRVRGWIDLHGV